MESLIGELQLGATTAFLILAVIFAVVLTRKWTKAEDKLDGLTTTLADDRRHREGDARQNAKEHGELWSKVNGTAGDVTAARVEIAELRGELRGSRAADPD